MLRFLGKLYGSFADLRNEFYERGLVKSHSLGSRTISIGNITTGGTGKTPLVAYVARILADAGERVCILTRGYGRQSSGRVLVSDGENVLVDVHEAGDEPLELARNLIGKAIVLADANRVAAAEWARNRFDITAFVLDDGFQHRRAKRDLDIVCVDATNPCGNGRVLPAGSLREPFQNLARADAIVVTRANLLKSTDDIATRLRRRNPEAPIFFANFTIGGISTLNDFATNAGTTIGQLPAGTFAFCALGNPESFLAQLKAQHPGISGLHAFADHHRYQQKDIEKVESVARSREATALITSAKDAVKLTGLQFTMPCFVAQLEVSITEPNKFRDLITSI